MKLTWVDGPPPLYVRRDKIAAALTLLATRPGKWAGLRKYDHVTSAYSKAVTLRRHHPKYEFVARANGKGGVIYGRKKP